MKNNSSKATDILLIVLGAAYLLGILFVFGPCAPAEDGHWMTCHWAGQALTVLAAVAAAIAVLHAAFRNADVKLGLSAALIPVSLSGLLVPGRMISLCMMADMRCRTF